MNNSLGHMVSGSPRWRKNMVIDIKTKIKRPSSSHAESVKRLNRAQELASQPPSECLTEKLMANINYYKETVDYLIQLTCSESKEKPKR